MPSAQEMERAAARRVRLVELIAADVRDKGFPPTVAELAAKAEVSPRQIRADLDLLQAEGVIERVKGAPRAIKINRPK